jgi:hypothetical protein
LRHREGNYLFREFVPLLQREQEKTPIQASRNDRSAAKFVPEFGRNGDPAFNIHIVLVFSDKHIQHSSPLFPTIVRIITYKALSNKQIKLVFYKLFKGFFIKYPSLSTSPLSPLEGRRHKPRKRREKSKKTA